MSSLTKWQKVLSEWFLNLPDSYQKELAQIFWILTTQDLSILGFNSKEMLIHFKNYLLKPDTPLRSLAKTIQIVSIIDLIITNFSLFKSHNWLKKRKKIINIEPKIWENIENRWKKLKQSYFSPDVISNELYLILKDEIIDDIYKS